MDMERYERQIIIPGFGKEKQKMLSKTKVVVPGLGSIVSTYLACAGVGYIRIVDRDKIEKSNLNCQILYTEQDIGKWKVDVAKKDWRR